MNMQWASDQRGFQRKSRNTKQTWFPVWCLPLLSFLLCSWLTDFAPLISPCIPGLLWVLKSLHWMSTHAGLWKISGLQDKEGENVKIERT